MSDLVYLDICCFKRPFDDASQERIRQEATAVAAALAAAERGAIRLVRSPAHDLENGRNPREDRRLATALWLDAAAVRLPASAEATERARELVAMGFTPIDALHLAFAEHAQAQWFVTTDDRLLKRGRAQADRLRIPVTGPMRLPLPEGEGEG